MLAMESIKWNPMEPVEPKWTNRSDQLDWLFNLTPEPTKSAWFSLSRLNPWTDRPSWRLNQTGRHHRARRLSVSAKRDRPWLLEMGVTEIEVNLQGIRHCEECWSGVLLLCTHARDGGGFSCWAYEEEVMYRRFNWERKPRGELNYWEGELIVSEEIERGICENKLSHQERSCRGWRRSQPK
jgi:hypothetical protein